MEYAKDVDGNPLQQGLTGPLSEYIAEDPEDPGQYFWKGSVPIVTYGYAITTHKAQGNEWENVYVDYTGTSWLRKNPSEKTDHRWLYTAVSRAQSKLRVRVDAEFPILTPNDAIEETIKTGKMNNCKI